MLPENSSPLAAGPESEAIFQFWRNQKKKVGGNAAWTPLRALQKSLEAHGKWQENVFSVEPGPTPIIFGGSNYAFCLAPGRDGWVRLNMFGRFFAVG